jgi:hypothetical protein
LLEQPIPNATAQLRTGALNNQRGVMLEREPITEAYTATHLQWIEKAQFGKARSLARQHAAEARVQDHKTRPRSARAIEGCAVAQ